jgi:hypothetical protein
LSPPAPRSAFTGYRVPPEVNHPGRPRLIAPVSPIGA